jgi:hypothetical protein
MSEVPAQPSSTGLGKVFYIHVVAEIVIIAAVAAFFMRRNSDLEQRIKTLEDTVGQLTAHLREVTATLGTVMARTREQGPMLSNDARFQPPPATPAYTPQQGKPSCDMCTVETKQDQPQIQMRRGAVVAPLMDNMMPFPSHPFNELGIPPMRNGANFISEMLMVPPLSMMSTLFGHELRSPAQSGQHGDDVSPTQMRDLVGSCSLRQLPQYANKEPRIQEIPDGVPIEGALIHTGRDNRVDIPFDDTLEDSDSEIAEELEELKLSEIKASPAQ